MRRELLLPPFFNAEETEIRTREAKNAEYK